MFNENVLVIIDMIIIKKKLKYDLIWFLIINQAVKINHRKFTIIIHKMHMIALNCSKQKIMIQQFLSQNIYLKNHIEILSTCWFKKILKKSKLNTYLIINMTFSAQINLLISKNLLFHNKLKNCELFHENCRITQCFNCYEYKHVVKICWKEKKCNICAASDYDDQICSFQNISVRHRCVNCNWNHLVWIIKYNKKKKYIKKIQLIYILHFRWYRIDNHNQYVLIKSWKQKKQLKQNIMSN